MEIIKEIEKRKIIPVVVLNDKNDAEPLAKALQNGGLPVAEVTFRTEEAEESIKIISAKFPEMLLGAGTVSSVKQAESAINAGAKFLVTAGFSRAVTEYALENDIAIFPGVCTPTELMLLLEYGLNIAKFFPAEQFGGLKTIKALAAPFTNMRFMPTGGINADNIKDYLSFEKVIACGGSWMVKDSLIREGRFDEIEKLTREAVQLIE